VGWAVFESSALMMTLFDGPVAFQCACLGKRRHRGRHLLLRVVVVRQEERSLSPNN